MWWRIARSLKVTIREEPGQVLVIELKGLLADSKTRSVLNDVFWNMSQQGYKRMLFDVRKMRVKRLGVNALVQTQEVAEHNFLNVVLVGMPKGLKIPESVKLSTAYRVAKDIPGGISMLATM